MKPKPHAWGHRARQQAALAALEDLDSYTATTPDEMKLFNDAVAKARAVLRGMAQ